MTRDDMIAAIISAIQSDSQLVALMRFSATRNLPNVPDANLQAIITALGLG